MGLVRNLLMFFFIIGCSEQYKFSFSGNDKNIFGSVIAVNNVQFLNTSCEGKVYLIRLGPDGRIADEVTSAVINNNGDFKLQLNSDYQLDKNIDHILEARYTDSCYQENLYRPLTQIQNKQIISAFTTLVTYAQKAPSAKKLNEVSKIEIEKILKKQTSASSFEAAYEALEEVQTVGDVFGISPESIKEVPPEVQITIPPVISEKVPVYFSLKASHWDKNYNIGQEWLLDGQSISDAVEWSTLFGANSSGEKELEVFVGKLEDGKVSRNSPYYYSKRKFRIENTILPQAPQLSLNSLIVRDRQLSVGINTGAGLINCESFSYFALTFEGSIPAVFNQSCISPNQQLENITIPGESGEKRLRLYVIDSQGKVSSPSEIVFQFDNIYPSVNLSPLANKYKGDQTLIFSVSLSDNIGLKSAKASLSDGSIVSSEVTIVDGQNSIHVPSWNTSSAAFHIVLEDFAGNITTFVSSLFEVDSTPPAAPSISLNSPSLTNNPIHEFTVNNCQDGSEISFSINENNYQWSPCVNSMTFNSAVTSDGATNIYSYMRDDVGNISAAYVIPVVYDFTPPQALISFSGLNPGREENINISLGQCIDIDKFSASVDGVFSSWVDCGSPFPVSVSAPDGIKLIQVKARDLAGNHSDVAVLNYQLDQTPPEFRKMVINPDETGVGERFAKTVFVNVALEFFERHAGSKVAFQMADVTTNECIAPQQDIVWTTTASTGVIQSIYSSQISTGDGEKKLCAYLEDRAGNISYSSISELENINFDKISFETGNIPQISQFYINKAETVATQNESLEVVWTLSDAEGLSNGPISIEYTLNNTSWAPLIDSSGNEITNYGNLVGYPKTYASSVSFMAPSSNYFRLRLRAVDMAGNDSHIAYSQAFNTGAWSIYAGASDSGIGSGPLSTSFRQSPNSGAASFAFDPKRGDLYIKTNDAGILKLNSFTGKSEVFIGYGNTLLPDNGVLDSNSKISSSFTLDFSQDGFLYINAAVSGQRSKIYRINPEDKKIEWIAGGGSVYTDLSQAKNLNTHYGIITLDEEGSLYTFLMCNTGNTTDTVTSAYKLIKLKKTGVVEHVAGDCSRASPPALGETRDAKSYSTGAFSYLQMGDIAVKENGNVIYLSSHGNGFITKIFNGHISRSNMSQSGMAGLRFGPDGHLYLSSGGVYKYSVGPSADTLLETIVGNDYTLDGCNKDFKSVLEACAVSYFRPSFTASGQLMYTDGPIINGPRLARIRYISDKSEVLSFAGTNALYGEGLDKSVLRGLLGSIYYQQSVNANTDFPEGLYVGAPEEAAIFRIDTLGKVHRHLGSGLGVQQYNNLIGKTLSPEISLGSIYMAGHNGALFNFYDGYMYLRAGSHFYRVGEGLATEVLMGGNQFWDNLSTSSSPSLGQLTAVNLMHNIAIKNGGVFFTGAAYSTTSNGVTTTSGNNSSSLRFLDFVGNKVVHIMGGTGTNAHVDDVLIDTNLSAMNFNSSYIESTSTFTAYDEHQIVCFLLRRGDGYAT